MNTPNITINEPTAWLRGTARHRARSLERTARTSRRRHPGSHIVALLNPRDVAPGTDADRTCDRCNTHCPDGIRYYLAAYNLNIAGTPVMLILGLCDQHMRAERPDVDQLPLGDLDKLGVPS